MPKMSHAEGRASAGLVSLTPAPPLPQLNTPLSLPFTSVPAQPGPQPAPPPTLALTLPHALGLICQPCPPQPEHP